MVDHLEEIRKLVREPLNEPIYCEFKRELAYETNKDKGELVKDVSSFANIDLEAFAGYGYLIFGVAPDGEVVGIAELPGDPPSDLRKVINGRLDRPVPFDYLTCDLYDSEGRTKRVAAIVIPDSKRRPHVVSKELKEQQDKKTTYFLRKDEVWVRKTGGRERANSEDFDAMYEGKLRKLVDDAVRPLADSLDRLERDVLELKVSIPKISFGFATAESREPQEEAKPMKVVGSLIPWQEVQD